MLNLGTLACEPHRTLSNGSQLARPLPAGVSVDIEPSVLDAVVADAPLVASPDRQFLVCVDNSEAGKRLGQRIVDAAGDSAARLLATQASEERLRLLSTCVFTWAGPNSHLTWEAAAMGSIPLLSAPNPLYVHNDGLCQPYCAW